MMDDKKYFLERMSLDRIVAFAEKLGDPVTDKRWRVPAIADHLARKRKLTVDAILDALNAEELAAAAQPLGIASDGEPRTLRARLRAALVGRTVRDVRKAALANTSEEIVVLPVEKLIDVVDGDTIKVQIEGEQKTVRLRGIDAPETSDEFGKKAEADIDRAKIASEEMFAMGRAAKAWLEERLRGRTLFLHVQRTPLGPQKYLHHNQHRLLAYVTLDAPDGEDIGAAMLREGYALVWPRGIRTRRYLHPLNERYVDRCCESLKTRPGLWGRGMSNLCPSGETGERWTRADCASCCSMT